MTPPQWNWQWPAQQATLHPRALPRSVKWYRLLPSALPQLRPDSWKLQFGLAFVPVDDVLHDWSLLKPLLMQYPAAAPFIDYFQKNWLYNRSYPISMWNCYGATLSDDPRTNNQAEGNNNALNTAAGCSSPTIYRLMDILKGFNAESELKILQTTTGLQATRKPRNNTIKMKERVKKTVQNYWRENIVLHCGSLGHLNVWITF